MTTPIRRRYVEVTDGEVHLAWCGEGPPVLLLHQTPRSWDEFREVLPVLGAAGFQVLALDTIGMGASSPITGEHSIERYAAAVLDVTAALDLGPVAVAGHHTGAVIALEVAAGAPDRITALVLSSCPWIDEPARERRRGRPVVDHASRSADGAHLVDLWRQRAAYYPADEPSLLDRFVRDALATTDPAAGHRAVSSYRMEERVGGVRAPTLCIGHAGDPFSFPDLQTVAAHLDAEVSVIDGGLVPLEPTADRWGSLVASFLRRTC